MIREGDGGERGHAGRGVFEHADEGFSERREVLGVISEGAGKVGANFNFVITEERGECVEGGGVFLTELAKSPETVQAGHERLDRFDCFLEERL